MAKILVVDDSSMSRRTLREALEGAGHAVVEAGDGMLALERYFLERPDAVMLDLVMQGLDGIATLSRLRELDPAARVIVATADIQRSSRELAANAGAREFINKPFAREEVIDAVRRVLEAAA